MKHIFKTLAAGLLVGLSLVSCNDNFDEGDAVSYPDRFELARYANDYTPKNGTSYTVNFHVTEQGDTVCDITTFNTKTKLSNVFSAGKVSYDPRIGVVTVDYEESMYDLPAQAKVAFRADGSGVIVNIYSNDGEKLNARENFTAVKTDYISFLGDWKLADGTLFSIYSDGTAELIDEEGNSLAKGTYTQDGGTVTLTFEGKTIVLTQDANGSVTSSVDGAAAIAASHEMSIPKNDWYEYAIGAYSPWLFVDGPFECIMEYSPSRLEARLTNYISGEGYYLQFVWLKGETEVSFNTPTFPTGWVYSEGGQTFGEVYAIPGVVDEAGNKGLYDPETKTFTFNISYQIPGVGGFGNDFEQFQISELLVEE